ncbi:MAG: DUF167 domain-containing protein [Candidatus Eisenbacteria bacterium]|uniref:UPF0235 protein HOP12_00940 n=1 Tax=Eiseniibacteriota bacterium TaxID=2212470 RepID=A0A849SGM8_UNCEI|nr:DUF167 domain-containing protein [Candidatus Eisenbacteria bacterium]
MALSTRLAVRVQPGARREGLVGWLADGSLKLRVSAAPEDGRANRAIEALLATRLGLASGAVAVVRGATSRMKQVKIEGLDDVTVRGRIDAALAGDADGE